MIDGKVELVSGSLSGGIKVGVEGLCDLVGDVGDNADGLAQAEGLCEGPNPLVVVGVRGIDDRG